MQPKQTARPLIEVGSTQESKGESDCVAQTVMNVAQNVAQKESDVAQNVVQEEDDVAQTVMDVAQNLDASSYRLKNLKFTSLEVYEFMGCLFGSP